MGEDHRELDDLRRENDHLATENARLMQERRKEEQEFHDKVLKRIDDLAEVTRENTAIIKPLVKKTEDTHAFVFGRPGEESKSLVGRLQNLEKEEEHRQKQKERRRTLKMTFIGAAFAAFFTFIWDFIKPYLGGGGNGP